jgi:hypothetical protein
MDAPPHVRLGGKEGSGNLYQNLRYSPLAGLLLDKVRSHLPLYRQPQRLCHAGIGLRRATLTQWGSARQISWNQLIRRCCPRFCKAPG